MTKYAVVKNGLVVNIAVWDGVTKWALPTECIVVIGTDPNCKIGSSYDGISFKLPVDEPISD